VTTTVDQPFLLTSLTTSGGVVIAGQGTLVVTQGIHVTGGQLKLAGGILQGAVTTSAGGTFVGTSAGGTLNNVAIAIGTTFDLTQVSGATCTVSGGLTVDGTITLGSSDGARTARLLSSATQTWAGSGSIVFGGSTGDIIQFIADSTTLTNQVTIRGQSGQFFSQNTATALINQGTISADVSGGLINILAGVSPLTNSGTIQAINGDTLNVASASWSGTGPLAANTAGILQLGGTFPTTTAQSVVQSAGTVQLTGTLANTGNVFTPASTGGPWVLAGGTLSGGTLSGASPLVGSTAGGTLNAVTVATGAASTSR